MNEKVEQQMGKNERLHFPQETKNTGDVRSKCTGLAPLVYEAIQQHLSSTEKALVLGEEGVLQLVDSLEPTPWELINVAWSDGLIRIAQNADILLLYAVRVEVEWDKTKLRRRLEDSIRKEWSVGDILLVAAAIGIRTG